MSPRSLVSPVEYSLVVPIYNDGYLAFDFCTATAKMFDEKLALSPESGRYEVVFVNDGSPNDSRSVLEREVLPSFPFARVVDLSRNFGQHVAISAGYRFASGDVVLATNVDMEDPPDEFPKLFSALRDQQLDIAIGVYRARKASYFNGLTSKVFHGTMNLLTGYAVPLNMAMSRAMSRRFIDAYNSLSEKSRYLPGLEAWLGFARAYVEVEHRPRTRGKSSYNFKKRLLLAIDSVISFSDLPLKVTVVVGLALVGAGLAMITGLIIARLMGASFQTGYVSLLSVVVLLGGLQVGVTGLASIYIGRILREIQNRPLFVVRDFLNFPARTEALKTETR